IVEVQPKEEDFTCRCSNGLGDSELHQYECWSEYFHDCGLNKDGRCLLDLQEIKSEFEYNGWVRFRLLFICLTSGVC
ncbi:hypothetical protein, partial [Pantoea sp. GbtcB22]|uniref:hypothetical protein n=1 Tax=Pantoea sp. GbtcB22 TaxID=2824767 RepID=UPI001C2FF0AD